MRIRTKNKTALMISAGAVLIVVAAVLFIWFLLRGETKVTGDFPDVGASKSLSCTAENIEYPFFEYDNATKKTTVVNVVFNGEKASSISLVQKIYYNDKKTAQASSTVNHSAMNKAFGNELGADALGANYNVTDNVMRLSLYASGNDFNINTRKFFLIKASLKGIEGYADYYTEQGFDCVEKSDEK